MTRQLTNIVSGFSFVVLAALTTSANADTWSHIDGIAKRIENRSEQLFRETKHYVHTPQYYHLRSDARDMARFADHIHEVAHHHGSLHHLESDLAQLDAKFHHLESLFDAIEHDAAYGHGHVHGNTNHVRRLLNKIEDDIHHLQEDIASLRRVSYHTYRPVQVAPRVYTVPQTYRVIQSHNHHAHHGHGQSGITLGRGNVRFHIKF